MPTITSDELIRLLTQCVRESGQSFEPFKRQHYSKHSALLISLLHYKHNGTAKAATVLSRFLIRWFDVRFRCVTLGGNKPYLYLGDKTKFDANLDSIDHQFAHQVLDVRGRL